MIQLGLGAGLLKNPADFNDKLLGSAAQFLTLGAVTAGDYRPGNSEPRTYAWPERNQYVNSVNLENPGSIAAADFIIELAVKVQAAEKGLRVNCTPTGQGTLGYILNDIAGQPQSNYVDRYELNFACPNHKESGQLSNVLAQDPKAVKEILKGVRGYDCNFSMKIAPRTTDTTLEELCDLCVEYDISAIVSGNTEKIEVPKVDGKPVLHKSITHCALSGEPLIKGNLRQVEFLRNHIKKNGYELEVEACGGIARGETLRAYEEAGADRAQLVCAYDMFGASIFSKVYQEYVELS